MALSTKASGEILYATEWNAAITAINAFSKTLSLTAYAAILPDTNPAAIGQTAYGDFTNHFVVPYAMFTHDGRNIERLYWISYLETGAGAVNFTAQAEAMVISNETQDAVYTLYAIRVPDGSTLDVDPPEVATLTVTHENAYVKSMSAVSAAFPITGTGDTVLWKVKRATTDDTLPGTSYLNAIKIVCGV
jgi:hypothetical protein